MVAYYLVNNTTNESVYDISLTHWVDTRDVIRKGRFKDIENIHFSHYKKSSSFDGSFSHESHPHIFKQYKTAADFMNALARCGYVSISEKDYIRYKKVILSIYQRLINVQ